MPYTVYLKKGVEKKIVSGQTRVYANEIGKIEGKGKNGDLASVLSFDGGFLGKGYINHLSKIPLRIFLWEDVEPDGDFFRKKIEIAKAKREKIGFDDCYRAFFSETDGLPGLIIDKYGDLLSVQILTLGMEKNRETILRSLIEVFSPRGIFERDDSPVREKEGLPAVKRKLYGDFDPHTIVTENGLKMTVDLENGQKTGYFLDQKENRLAIRRYCKGADVLDCFCNSGGFSLNAAAGGAKSILSADISEKALEDVRTNAEMNGFSNVIRTECGDVFSLLRRFRKEERTFGLIVVDPPAFCKSVAEVQDAIRGYRDINLLAMKSVRKGGFLVTCSCSHYVTFPVFEKMLREAAVSSGRRVSLYEMRTQSADHASLFCDAEGSYLKFYIFGID